MKFTLLLSMLLCFFFHVSYAQSFNNSQLVSRMWTHATGNPGDTLNWTNQTIDASRNLIIIGNNLLNDQTTDMLLTKYKGSDGSVLWQVQYDSTGHDDFGIALVTDASRNVYTASTSFISSTNGYDWIIQKYDSNGTVKWTKTFNSGLYDVPTDIKYDGSGNLYITGVRTATTTFLDYCTIKYDASTGYQFWATPAYYDYTNLVDIPAAITIASNGKIIVAGGSGSTLTNWDFATVRYNPSNGAQINVVRNPSNGLGFDQVTGIAKDLYDNIYITGRAAVTGNSYDVKIVKLDTALNTVWSVTKDGGDHLDDGGNAIGVDASGYVYVTGYTKKANGGTDYFTLKYSGSGTLVWSRNHTASDPTKNAMAKKLDIDPYGNVLITGDAYNIGNSDILSLAYDINGNLKWEDWIAGLGNGDDYASGIKIDDATDFFYVTGKTWSGTQYQYTTTKYQMMDYITPPDIESTSSSFAYYENKGQVMGTNDTLQPNIQFYTLHHYPDLYFQNSKVNFVFSKIDTIAATSDTLHRIDLSFFNSTSTKVYKVSPSVKGYLNYFKPWCQNGVTKVNGYSCLLYPNLYSHIDLVVSSNGAGLKQYFVCDIGSRPTDIILKFNGASSVTILGNGKLQVTSVIGDITFEVPTVYQIDANGNVVTLNWQSYYVSLGSNKYSFHLGNYDATKPLIFEIKKASPPPPQNVDNIQWSTYIGGNTGSQGDWAWDVYTDNSNNVYVTGTVGNSDFPTVPLNFQTNLHGDQDAFVTKFDNQNIMVASTFIGGTHPTFFQEGSRSVRVDGQDRIFIAGYTGAWQNFPTQNFNPSNSQEYFEPEGSGTHQTGFISCFSSDLTDLIWSTFLNDPAEYINESAYGLAIDNSDNIYVVGQNAHPGAVTGPVGSYKQNGWSGSIGMFNSNFEVLWSTGFGGYTGGYYNGWTSDIVYSCVLDDNNRLYITGRTGEPVSLSTCSAPTNSEFPICTSIGIAPYSQSSFGGGDLDAFIACFNSNHVLEWSSYFGGSGNEEAFSIDVNHGNKLIAITGRTTTTVPCATSAYCEAPFPAGSFPLCNPYQAAIGSNNNDDAFVARFTDAGIIEFSTYLGGNDVDEGNGVAFDLNHNLFITGFTQSSNFPYKENGDYYHHHQFGTQDAFITAFDFNNSLLWSTDYGGDQTNPYNLSSNTLGTACDVNSNLSLYVVGVTNCGDLPIVYTGDQYNQSFGNCPTCNPIPDDDDAFICQFDVSNIVGIAESTLTENSFNIFPNPTFSEITLTCANSTSVNNLEIKDVSGKTLKRIHLASSAGSSYKIDVSDLPSGMYLLTFNGPDYSIVKKFIIQE